MKNDLIQSNGNLIVVDGRGGDEDTLGLEKNN